MIAVMAQEGAAFVELSAINRFFFLAGNNLQIVCRVRWEQWSFLRRNGRQRRTESRHV